MFFADVANLQYHILRISFVFEKYQNFTITLYEYRVYSSDAQTQRVQCHFAEITNCILATFPELLG